MIVCAVLVRCFRGGILFFLHVSPCIAEIQKVVGNPRVDRFVLFANSCMAASCTTPLMLSMRTCMKNIYSCEFVALSGLKYVSNFFSFSKSNRYACLSGAEPRHDR